MEDNGNTELIDKLLRDNLTNKTSEVPRFVWTNIEKEITEKGRKKGFLWFLTFGFLWDVFNTSKNEKNNFTFLNTNKVKAHKIKKGKITFSFVVIGLVVGILALVTTTFILTNKQVNNERVEIGHNDSSIANSESSITFTNHATSTIYQNKNTRSHKELIEKNNKQPLVIIENSNSIDKLAKNKHIEKELVLNRSKNPNNNTNDLLTLSTTDNKSELSNAQINTHLSNAKLNTKLTPNILKNHIIETGGKNDTNDFVSISESKIDLSLEYLQLLKTNYIDHPSYTPDVKFVDFKFEPAVLEDSVGDQQNHHSCLSLTGSAGNSVYDVAIYKNYFTSGQLSNRTFNSSGYEFSLGVNYNLNTKFSVYTLVNYNQKKSMFEYDVLIDDNAFYNYYSVSELIPLDNLDNKSSSNCHTAKNVKVNYQINSWLLSLGTTYEIFQLKKLSASIDLRMSTNILSSLTIQNYSVVKGLDNKKETINIVKPGLGILLNYQLNKKVQLGFSPIYMMQFNSKKETFYSKMMKEFIIPVSISYKF